MNKKFLILILMILFTYGLNAQEQIGTIIGESAYQNFGFTLAMSGNGKQIITSSPKSDNCGNNCGQIQVYRYIKNKWEQIGRTIFGNKPGDYFGSSIDLSYDGSRIILSSPNSNENGYTSGIVKVYEWYGNKWRQLGQTISGNSKDMFGSIVKISDDGNHIAISCPFSQKKDFVRIYEFKNKEWTKKGQDLISNSASEYFGAAISLNSIGNRIAIGIHNPNSLGYVQIFDFKNDNWIQNGFDIKSDKEKDDFGFSVSLSGEGNTLAIGIPKGNKSNDMKVGAIKVFRQKNNNWMQVGNSLFGENEYDLFGQSVSISYNGNRLIASSIFSDVNGANCGQARIFEYKKNNWNPIFSKNGSKERDYLGKALSISSKGDRVSISSTEEWIWKQGNGSIQVFNIPIRKPYNNK